MTEQQIDPSALIEEARERADLTHGSDWTFLQRVIVALSAVPSEATTNETGSASRWNEANLDRALGRGVIQSGEATTDRAIDWEELRETVVQELELGGDANSVASAIKESAERGDLWLPVAVHGIADETPWEDPEPWLSGLGRVWGNGKLRSHYKHEEYANFAPRTRVQYDAEQGIKPTDSDKPVSS